MLAWNLQCSQGELLNIKNQSTSLFLFVAHTRLIIWLFAWERPSLKKLKEGDIEGYPIPQYRKKNWQIPKYRVENRPNTDTAFMIGHAYLTLYPSRIDWYNDQNTRLLDVLYINVRSLLDDTQRSTALSTAWLKQHCKPREISS